VSGWDAIAQALAEVTGHKVIIAASTRQPSASVSIKRSGSLEDVVGSLAKRLRVGWQVEDDGTLVLSSRLASLPKAKLVHTQLQYDRLQGYVALPRLFAQLDRRPEPLAKASTGRKVLCKKGTDLRRGEEHCFALSLVCVPGRPGAGLHRDPLR